MRVKEDGTIYISTGDNNDGDIDKAKSMIETIVFEPEKDGIYTGKVTRIEKYGAFVEIAPGTEGLLHISQISDKRIQKVEDELKLGDEVTVKVTEIDEQGRINLSRKALYSE